MSNPYPTLSGAGLVVNQFLDDASLEQLKQVAKGDEFANSVTRHPRGDCDIKKCPYKCAYVSQ
jgi:hypothetical protein